MRQIRILWIDDEIEVLKPHIMFLGEKGYVTDTCAGGTDAIALVREKHYDIVFLDEYMPGLSGIETLRRIKEIKPSVPVVMITKSEEEEIMEAAIGSQIADYLIKPVKPRQILLSLKKILETESIVTRQTTSAFRDEFGAITEMISSAITYGQWYEIYRKLVFWQGELSRSSDPGMREVLKMQESDANRAFSRFIEKNYQEWLSPSQTEKPLLSHSLMSKSILPLIRKGSPLFCIIIDNMRLDQWNAIVPDITSFYKITGEDLYMSILPTATQYSRNAIFAGVMPSVIESTMPEYWIRDYEDEGKNLFEDKLFARNLQRNGISCTWSFHKVSNEAEGRAVNEKLPRLLSNDLILLVYNFVDLLSHARTEVDLIRDMTGDDASWLTMTRSWFIHSPLIGLLKVAASKGARVIITTDHGSIRVNRPVKVVGDRFTSLNLRYKTGKSLDYNPRDVFEITNPERAGLPKTNISSRYIFARETDFLVYPNNFNNVASYYRDSLQHGGVSMQEMILPLICLEPL